MSQPDLILKAGCKVNLNLRIVSRREDGYHDIESLFFPLPEPSDRLDITFLPPSGGFSLSCSDSGLNNRDNILFRAWQVFGERTGFWADMHVHLHKGIPSGAGLGGGSSDAAVLLRVLAQRCPHEPEETELLDMAAGLGADVPFFLSPQPSWVTGTGDRLEPATVDLSGLTLILACPPDHVSTGWAYAEWDRSALPAEDLRDPRELTSAHEKNTNPRLRTGLWFVNGFERVVFPHFPDLRRIKERLLGSGASACVMSGSGASLCALFRTAEQARAAQAYLDEISILSHAHRL